MSRVRALVEKEWREAFRSGLMAVSAAVLFVVFTLLPLFPLVTIRAVGGRAGAEAEILRGMPPALRGHPRYAGLAATEIVQAHYGGVFILFFLVMPATLPGMITGASIVGEKREKSLEPLLATPITTGELLLGKAAAAVLPAVAMGWASFGAYLALAALLAASPRVLGAMLDLPRLLAIAILPPVLALLNALAGLLVSSRVNDPRTAQSVTGLLVLPVIGFFGAQVAGLVTVSAGLVVVAALGILALDAVLLYAAVKVFQRETILTRWR
jgi:ABC-2 type transport system permease protein